MKPDRWARSVAPSDVTVLFPTINESCKEGRWGVILRHTQQTNWSLSTISSKSINFRLKHFPFSTENEGQTEVFFLN